MHRPAGLFVFVATLALFVQPWADSVARSTDNQVRREATRLRSHFDSVLLELRARDVSHLSGRQQVARAELVTWLDEYRDAGRFPLNDRYADFATPIFRDARGVTCAMAYLVERSGRGDIVDRIAAKRNLAYIAELTDDSALVAWLDGVGLDVAEAARIQPAYPGNEIEEDAAFTGVTVVLSTMSLATALLNVRSPRESMGFAGIVIGAATVFIGQAMYQDHEAKSVINLTSGGLAIIAGMYAAFRPRPVTPDRHEPTKARSIQWSTLMDWAPHSGQTRVGLVTRF